MLTLVLVFNRTWGEIDKAKRGCASVIALVYNITYEASPKVLPEWPSQKAFMVLLSPVVFQTYYALASTLHSYVSLERSSISVNGGPTDELYPLSNSSATNPDCLSWSWPLQIKCLSRRNDLMNYLTQMF